MSFFRPLLAALLLAALAPVLVHGARALLFSGSAPGGGGQPTITGISLSNASFAGGAANGTVVGTITVTTSDNSTPALALATPAAGIAGSGSDANSFQISGATLETNTAGGTDQPGTYHICIVASGAYGNSPQRTCPAISATGPGGAGWQLSFSDEFACPGGMLECGQDGYGSVVAVSSYTWSSGFCSGLASPSAAGCGVLTLASLPGGISAANCTGTHLGACDLSVAGATNTGGAGNSAVNGTFLVAGVPDATHIDLYMPYSGIAATMGGTITAGSGPWVIANVNTCSSGTWPACVPSGEGALTASNDNGGETEYWDPHACEVASVNLLKLNITDSGTWNGGGYLNASGATTANYIPPDAMQVTTAKGFGLTNAGTATMCHLQTWNGAAGFGAAAEFYFDDDVDGPPGDPHAAVWSETTTNLWPPEIDYPDFVGFNASDNYFKGGGGEYNLGPTTLTGFAQYSIDVSGTTITWYQAGSGTAFTSTSLVAADQGKSWYPILDVTQDGGGNSPTFPSVMQAHYFRAYQKVASGACYAAIPAATTIPHTGTC